ncbi:uncharacterized protein TNCV_1875601 [Trichonephila clavipes]|nr:uncharacterized protein TNCV_1875601 [Trichonephila clavipes]
MQYVGHVQKRMGCRLRKLKALWGEKKLFNGKTIGEKGRLTDAVISKLTTFCGNAIRANSQNVNEMRQAVWAVWAHISSTDDEPKHWFYPKGKKKLVSSTSRGAGITLLSAAPYKQYQSPQVSLTTSFFPKEL